jgi:hypothetical protein
MPPISIRRQLKGNITASRHKVPEAVANSAILVLDGGFSRIDLRATNFCAKKSPNNVLDMASKLGKGLMKGVFGKAASMTMAFKAATKNPCLVPSKKKATTMGIS